MLTYYEHPSFDCSAAVVWEDAGPLSRPVTFDLLTLTPKINPRLRFLNVIVVCSEFGGLRFNDFSTYHMKTNTVTYIHYIQSDTCSWLVMLCISALYAVGRDDLFHSLQDRGTQNEWYEGPHSRYSDVIHGGVEQRNIFDSLLGRQSLQKWQFRCKAPEA